MTHIWKKIEFGNHGNKNSRLRQLQTTPFTPKSTNVHLCKYIYITKYANVGLHIYMYIVKLI